VNTICESRTKRSLLLSSSPLCSDPPLLASKVSTAMADHKPQWNPELQEWFCAACGRTSDHKLETDARAELDAFECKIIGIQSREYTEEEIQKWWVTKKMKNKF